MTSERIAVFQDILVIKQWYFSAVGSTV